MEIIPFKDQEQLTIDHSFEIADSIAQDLFGIFAAITEQEPNSDFDMITYGLLMIFAEVLMGPGRWTPENLSKDITDLANRRRAEEEANPPQV